MRFIRNSVTITVRRKADHQAVRLVPLRREGIALLEKASGDFAQLWPLQVAPGGTDHTNSYQPPVNATPSRHGGLGPAIHVFHCSGPERRGWNESQSAGLGIDGLSPRPHLTGQHQCRLKRMLRGHLPSAGRSRHPILTIALWSVPPGATSRRAFPGCIIVLARLPATVIGDNFSFPRYCHLAAVLHAPHALPPGPASHRPPSTPATTCLGASPRDRAFMDGAVLHYHRRSTGL